MRRRRAAGAVLTALVLGGCGVPLSDAATAIPDLGSPSSSASPSQGPTADPELTTTLATATVWYVEGDGLVPRGVPAPGPLTPTGVLELLASTPEGSVDLRTLNVDPLGGPPLASWVEPTEGASPDTAQQVLLSPTFSELASEDQVLLLGQVAFTLTEVDGRPVQFVDATSAPLSVPLPDGRLREGPVTRGDYASLT